MWVFCSGMMRSGSTLQYQIAKALIEGAGRGSGVGSCAPGRFRELLQRYDDPEQVYVVKSHRYLPTAHARLAAGAARSLYIYRDLRDVVVSMMHKESRTFRQLMDARFVQEILQDDAIWSSRPHTLVSVYEEVTADVASEVARIAAFLDIDLPPEELARIAESHSLASQSRRLASFDFGQKGVAEGRANLLDPETLLHHNHVRSGASEQWADELTQAQVSEIERIAGDWLAARGYRLTDPGAAPSAPARVVRRMGRGAAARRARLAADAGFRLAPKVAALKSTLFRPLRRLSDVLTSVPFARLVLEPLYRLTGRRARGEASLAAARQILVVRVDEIGDVVLTTPLLRELRHNAPDAEITLVVKPGVRNLVEACPYVDRVLTYDWSVTGLFGRLKRHLRATRLARRHLLPLRLDLALLPRWARDRYHGAFLTYFSGAAHRVGYSETVTAAKREMNAGEDRLFTRTLETRGTRHEVERGLDMLRELGGVVRDDHLELWTDEDDEAHADRLLDGHVADGRPLIAVGIGAGSQRRVWPMPRFAEVAAALGERHGARFVVLGGREDHVLGETFSRHTDDSVLNLVGKTTLRQAVAVLRRCDLYVGNDTGVMHLAAAVGVRVVEISCHPLIGRPEHDHSPERFGPWGVEHRILRPERPLDPCTDGCRGRVAHCIMALSVDQALQAAEALLPAPLAARHTGTEPLP